MVLTSSWMWSTKWMGLDFRKHLWICGFAEWQMTFNMDKGQVIYSGKKNIWNHSKGRALRAESWPSKEPWASLWVIPKDISLNHFISKNANKYLGTFKVKYWRESKHFHPTPMGTPRISASRLGSHGPQREVDSDLPDQAGRANGGVTQEDEPPHLRRWGPRKTQSTWMRLFAQIRSTDTEMFSN